MGTFLMETLSDKLVPLEAEGKKTKHMKYICRLFYSTTHKTVLKKLTFTLPNNPSP